MKATTLQLPARRERERLQRAESILDSAERLFLERGFAATTMNDIGEAAEFSRASLYHYFASKELIYVAILERAMDALITRASTEPETVAGAAKRIEALKDALLEFMRQKQNLFRLYFITRLEVLPYLDTKLAKRLEKKTRQLESVFHGIYREGVERGELKPLDPLAMGDIFFAQIIGLMLLNTTEKLEPPLTDNVNKATAFFLQNIQTNQRKKKPNRSA